MAHPFILYEWHSEQGYYNWYSVIFTKRAREEPEEAINHVHYLTV